MISHVIGLCMLYAVGFFYVPRLAAMDVPQAHSEALNQDDLLKLLAFFKNRDAEGAIRYIRSAGINRPIEKGRTLLHRVIEFQSNASCFYNAFYSSLIKKLLPIDGIWVVPIPDDEFRFVNAAVRSGERALLERFLDLGVFIGFRDWQFERFTLSAEFYFVITHTRSVRDLPASARAVIQSKKDLVCSIMNHADISPPQREALLFLLLCYCAQDNRPEFLRLLNLVSDVSINDALFIHAARHGRLAVLREMDKRDVSEDARREALRIAALAGNNEIVWNLLLWEVPGSDVKQQLHELSAQCPYTEVKERYKKTLLLFECLRQPVLALHQYTNAYAIGDHTRLEQASRRIDDYLKADNAWLMLEEDQRYLLPRFAALSDDYDLMVRLIDAGVDVCLVDSSGRSALNDAIEPRIIRLLLMHGTYWRQLPVQASSMMRNAAQVVSVIQQDGLNAEQTEALTLLLRHFCAIDERRQFLGLLAKVNDQTMVDMIFLHAARHGRLSLLIAIEKKGISEDVKRRAMRLAAVACQDEIVCYLSVSNRRLRFVDVCEQLRQLIAACPYDSVKKRYEVTLRLLSTPVSSDIEMLSRTRVRSFVKNAKNAIHDNNTAVFERVLRDFGPKFELNEVAELYELAAEKADAHVMRLIESRFVIPANVRDYNLRQALFDGRWDRVIAILPERDMKKLQQFIVGLQREYPQAEQLEFMKRNCDDAVERLRQAVNNGKLDQVYDAVAYGAWINCFMDDGRTLLYNALYNYYHGDLGNKDFFRSLVFYLLNQDTICLCGTSCDVPLLVDFTFEIRDVHLLNRLIDVGIPIDKDRIAQGAYEYDDDFCRSLIIGYRLRTKRSADVITNARSRVCGALNDGKPVLIVDLEFVLLAEIVYDKPDLWNRIDSSQVPKDFINHAYAVAARSGNYLIIDQLENDFLTRYNDAEVSVIRSNALTGAALAGCEHMVEKFIGTGTDRSPAIELFAARIATTPIASMRERYERMYQVLTKPLQRPTAQPVRLLQDSDALVRMALLGLGFGTLK